MTAVAVACEVERFTSGDPPANCPVNVRVFEFMLISLLSGGQPSITCRPAMQQPFVLSHERRRNRKRITDRLKSCQGLAQDPVISNFASQVGAFVFHSFSVVKINEGEAIVEFKVA